MRRSVDLYEAKWQTLKECLTFGNHLVVIIYYGCHSYLLIWHNQQFHQQHG